MTSNASYLKDGGQVDGSESAVEARIATAQNAPLATAVQTHLQTLGPIRAAVLGHFGECSLDIHHLVRAAAESLAARRLPDGGPWERDLNQKREVTS